MNRMRSPALVGLLLVMYPALGGTLGYAWYLRSRGYRENCAARLSAALGLPSDIGRIVPRSFRTRQFDDVVVWLPQRRGQAFRCATALLTTIRPPGQPETFELDLAGGACEISTRTWLQEDYRRVLESGLRPGFGPQGPRRVRFTRMNLLFERDRFQGTLDHASGTVDFPTPLAGFANLQCSAFNGFSVPEPAVLAARFSPQPGGIQLDELQLTVPRLPVTVLGLDALLGTQLRTGWFAGQSVYSESGGTRRWRISGTCFDVLLPEWTAGLATRPWRGTGAELQLKELLIEDRRPRRLRFGGVLTGVVLGDILAPWGIGEAGGELVLRVRDLDLSPDGLERLAAAGQCSNMSLAAITGALGYGQLSGTAQLVIDDLVIERNRLRALEAEFRVADSGEPHWVEGRLLLALVERLLHVSLPAVLPERLEYGRLGLRMEVQDERLRIFGTHGPRDATILTAHVLGREVPVLTEPPGAINLTPWLDRLRAQAAVRLRATLDQLAARHGEGPFSLWWDEGPIRSAPTGTAEPVQTRPVDAPP